MSENHIIGNSIFRLIKPAARIAASAPAAQTREAAVVERIRAGDKTAFNELYKMFAPTVYAIILARVPRDAVEDVMQNAFLAAYRNLHNLREPDRVAAWLAQIARNHAAEFYRNARPTEELPENLSCNPDNSKSEAAEILAEIRALPDAYRETLVLRLVEGMTGAEIAEKTGMTPDSVRVNLHRGMKLLRQKLGVSGENR